MSSRVRSPLLIAAALVAAAALAQPPAAAKAPRAWTPPARIPGTAGLFNPFGATAPDGTDLVLWGESTDVPLENRVRAKVRLPGRATWVNVPPRLHGQYLGVSDVEPTPSGDFWVVYTVNAGPYESYIVRLDTRNRRWTKPVRLFQDQTEYYHGSADIERAGDGTLVVTAYSPLIAGGGEARVAVGIRHPGRPWLDRFVSPAGHFANPADLSVNASGDILVSFLQENTLPTMTVRAATRAHGKHAKWQTSTLSTPGDSQRVHSGLGNDGTAAVAWTATSTSPFEAVRMSTRNVRRASAPWVGHDVVTGSSVSTDAYAVVGPHGDATALWSENDAGIFTLWSRTLDGSTLQSPVQLSRVGESAALTAIAALPNGRTAVLYKRLGSGGHSLGTDYRTMSDGAAGPAVSIIGDETVDGDTGAQWLGVDAASQATDIYGRGTNPDVDFAWLTNADPGPKAMTGPVSGRALHRARVAGRMAAGKRVACATGYWVETSSLTYHWQRDGRRIHDATAKRYRVTARDRGHRLSCTVAGSNSSSRRLLLTSPARRVA
jgi:hypothetical protein